MNVQDAIRWLDDRYSDEPDMRGMVDGMVGSLEQGWIEPAEVVDGELRFKMTDAGRRHVEGMGILP